MADFQGNQIRTTKMQNIDKRILSIALPSIVANITVPLLGLVDMAVSGHLGNAVYIGAVAVGSMIFNVVYWVFGFLRMGTSGMTSQALGRRDMNDVATTLARSIVVAMAVAAFIIILQKPLGSVALALVGASTEINTEAWRYFRICVWGAPAMLCLYSLTGWYIGMQNTRLPMFISIMQNVVNIVASCTFVYAFGMKVEGIALGTLVAQYAGLLVSITLWATTYGKRILRHVQWQRIMEGTAMGHFFSVNRDIFLRTLCLVAVNFYFLSAGAAQGAVVLAVNTLLMQLFTLYSYVMDGFAFAGEALCGKHYGAGNHVEFSRTVRRLFGWGFALTVAYTMVYAVGGTGFLRLLTDDIEVVAASAEYAPWAVLIPICGLAAFIWDGVFIGTTNTRGMFAATAAAMLVFFGVYLSLRSEWQNHALWLAFLTFLLTRGAVQSCIYWRKQ